ITLTNNGPGVLQSGESITVLERPGTGVSITSYEMISSNATVDGEGEHALVTATEDVAEGESIQIRVITTVSAASGSTITNGISVWGPDTPPEDDPDDEDDTPEIPVGDPYTLSISKSSDKNRVRAGEETTFTVTIRNEGPESVPAGHNLAIRELPGIGLTILGYEVTAGPATVQGSVNTATVTTTADIPAGGLITISIRAKVDERASGTITNKIQVWGDSKNPDTDDPDAEDETPPVDIDSELVIPNLFTPNGDGLNDRFVIQGLYQYDQAELLIINRWGNRVYHAKPYQNNWDGGSLADGTYFYILTLTKGGETTVHRGPVAIVRNTGRN
ncbi:MAG TPA: gliding motility-associated C-terminal domain-containing protein, partial [Sphingobacteriaceae bacterium]|nr:gliding motility-associated C-terminal domain-containing protein [Sphingobacteriaceae bacterium]